jgi:hypothetical protein
MKCREEFVRKSQEDERTQQREQHNGNCVVHAGETRGSVLYGAVKLGTELFSGTGSVDKMLLRVADRELEVRKCGNNPKGLIGIKSGLGCHWLGRDGRDLKGTECVR